MINSHIVIYTYSHCNIYTLIVNKNLVLIYNNNMNSLYMENHTHQLSIRENHTSTLYTHLDKLRQVNLSTYAQLKVPHTFEFKWYKNEETFTMKSPIISLFLNNKN